MHTTNTLMPRTDTLYLTDSSSCKLLIVDFYPIQKDSVKSINQLWSSTTKIVTDSTPLPVSKYEDLQNNLMSGIIFAFFIALIIFSREILVITPAITKTLFSYKNHIKLEEKLGLTNQRNIVAMLSVFYIPLIILLIAGKTIEAETGMFKPYFYLASVGVLLSYWILKKTMFGLISWITREKNAFYMIEKFSYNHIILLSLLSFVIFIVLLADPSISEQTLFMCLLAIALFVYSIYLIRTCQIIIKHSFSIIFYILYLCAVELLPISLFINFILSL